MYDGTGSRIDEKLRHGHIEGVCEKIHKGTVRVGFWVGNCGGYGSADAYTGWNSVSRIYVEEVPSPKAQRQQVSDFFSEFKAECKAGQAQE